jgi:hypothetical protein
MTRKIACEKIIEFQKLGSRLFHSETSTGLRGVDSTLRTPMISGVYSSPGYNFLG